MLDQSGACFKAVFDVRSRIMQPLGVKAFMEAESERIQSQLGATSKTEQLVGNLDRECVRAPLLQDDVFYQRCAGSDTS